MSTPLDTSSPAQFEPAPFPQTAPAITPDNPPYGLLAALSLWLISILLLLIANVVGIAAYMLYEYGTIALAQATKILEGDQKNLIFVSLVCIIPAHLLTLLAARAIVTRFGRYPFWRTVGWEWAPGMGPLASVALGVMMLIIGLTLTWAIGGGETKLDQMIASSARARWTTALLATFTAPLVEEMVYRGVLFPALRRAVGALWAVVAVSVLFASVHIAQYDNNLGVISAVFLLSIVLTAVRAITGKLLPCFTIHFVFNGVQAALLLAEPYLSPLLEQNKTPAAALISIVLQQLFAP